MFAGGAPVDFVKAVSLRTVAVGITVHCPVELAMLEFRNGIRLGALASRCVNDSIFVPD